MAGFIEAQDRFRVQMGEDVVFHIANDPVWPDDVMVDPETGHPYDPTIVPESGGDESDIIIHVHPIQAPIQRGSDDVIEGPSGPRRDEVIAFRMAAADYPLVQDAVGATWRDIRYKLSEFVNDGDQYIAFGEAM